MEQALESVRRNPRSPLVQGRIAASQLEIALVAVRLIDENGWDGVSVAQIAATAGVSERTFYRYFPKKADALRPLLDTAGERFCRAFAQSSSHDLAGRTGRAFQEALEEFPGGLENARTVYRLMHSTSPMTTVWLEGAFAMEIQFAEVLAATVPQLTGAADSRLLAAILLAAQRFAILEWVAPTCEVPLADLTARYVRRALGFPPNV